MKLLVSLALIVGVISAASIPRRNLERPHESLDGAPITTVSIPADAPEGYNITTGQPSLKLEKSSLLELPSELAKRNQASTLR